MMIIINLWERESIHKEKKKRKSLSSSIGTRRHSDGLHFSSFSYFCWQHSRTPKGDTKHVLMSIPPFHVEYVQIPCNRCGNMHQSIKNMTINIKTSSNSKDIFFFFFLCNQSWWSHSSLSIMIDFDITSFSL